MASGVFVILVQRRSYMTVRPGAVTTEGSLSVASAPWGSSTSAEGSLVNVRRVEVSVALTPDPSLVVHAVEGTSADGVRCLVSVFEASLE